MINIKRIINLLITFKYSEGLKFNLGGYFSNPYDHILLGAMSKE